MKKLITLAAAALISVTAAFAENAFHFGAYFPLYSYEVEGEDISSSVYGASVDYVHISDSGYTWKIGAALGNATNSDCKSILNQDDLTGFDFEIEAGFGGSLIHDDKMTLSLTGNIGFRVQVLENTETNNLLGIEATTTYGEVIGFAGPQVSFTYKILEHLGFYADLGIYYNTGYIIYEYDIKDSYNSNDSDDRDVSGFSAIPRIGIALVF
ncbi:hypothetical protein [Treponema sp.]|uniref:hypothetical protein n=1 Tax=Treponema sp. TaxID=166 RepID=UPI0025F71B4A|nr:hypothetical protein [Treponema sp.]MCR5218656.1 hypothetical protein [Treponema sp.]